MTPPLTRREFLAAVAAVPLVPLAARPALLPPEAPEPPRAGAGPYAVLSDPSDALGLLAQDLLVVFTRDDQYVDDRGLIHPRGVWRGLDLAALAAGAPLAGDDDPPAGTIPLSGRSLIALTVWDLVAPTVRFDAFCARYGTVEGAWDRALDLQIRSPDGARLRAFQARHVVLTEAEARTTSAEFTVCPRLRLVIGALEDAPGPAA